MNEKETLDVITINEPNEITKKDLKINKCINDFFARRKKLNKEKYRDKEIPYILIMSRLRNEDRREN